MSPVLLVVIPIRQLSDARFSEPRSFKHSLRDLKQPLTSVPTYTSGKSASHSTMSAVDAPQTDGRYPYHLVRHFGNRITSISTRLHLQNILAQMERETHGVCSHCYSQYSTLRIFLASGTSESYVAYYTSYTSSPPYNSRSTYLHR